MTLSSLFEPCFRILFYVMWTQWFVEAPFFHCTVKFVIQSHHIINSFAFGFPFFICLDYGFVVTEFSPTRTCPCAFKTGTIFTVSFCTCFSLAIMLFIGMFTETFKIIWSMGRDVIKAFAFTFGGFAMRIFTLWI